MPRVNRDLQRRLAARRERERRRPADRRYQFAPTNPEPVLAPDEAMAAAGATNGEEVFEAQAEGPVVETPVRRGTAARAPAGTRAARAAPRPFSAYRDEYRYVIGDLRRIVVVIGSLLLVLIVLSLVLPR